MKTLKNTLLAFVAIALTAPVFNGCKKGEGDPAISLRSRKARVAGEWTVTKYANTWSSTSGTPAATSSSITNYDGTNLSGSNTSGSTTTTWPTAPTTQTKTWTMTFETDGTWKSNEVETTTSTGYSKVETKDESGLWNFEAGVGEAKKKEYMTMTTTASTTTTVTTTSGVSGTTTSTDTDSGKGGSKVSLQITTLKNKEMVMHYDYSTTNSTTSSGTTTSSSGTGSADMTLTAK